MRFLSVAHFQPLLGRRLKATPVLQTSLLLGGCNSKLNQKLWLTGGAFIINDFLRNPHFSILTVKSGELLMAADDEIMDVVRLRACPWLSLRFLGSLELVEEILLLLLNGTDVEVDILSWLSWTELERKNSGLGIEKFNLERIFDDSVVGGRIVVSLFVGWGGIAFSGSCRGFITGWGFTTVQECVFTIFFYHFITQNKFPLSIYVDS